MGEKKLLQLELPEFDMPDIFKEDIWKIKEWDYYKNAAKKHRIAWDKRSAITNGNLDFTLCENEFIREELKYVMYKRYMGNINPGSLGDCYDRLKIVCRFINDNTYNSFSEITNIAPFERHLAFKEHNSVIINDCDRINGDMEKVKMTRKNRSTAFFLYCIKTVNEYCSPKLPLMQRDIWSKDELKKYSKETNYRTLDFRNIKQPEIKYDAKVYCRSRFGTIVIPTIATYLKCIVYFCDWLYKYDSSILYLNQLSRDIMEVYFEHLRTQSGMPDNRINVHILYLKAFLDTLPLLELKNVPTMPLILPNDYTFKSKKECEYFTDEEIDNIKKNIKYLDKTDGKIIYCLIVLGVRISELLNLKPEDIRKDENGEYYLVIYQNKTIKEYYKPITKAVAKVLLSEIAANKKRFGHDPEYVFLSINENRIDHSNLSRRINKVFYEKNVLNKDGKLLRFTTHKFRATFATNLINAGYGAEQTSQMLGHSSIDALTHYINIHNETTLRQLKPRLDKDDMLIRNIGHMENIVVEEPQNAIPLCNGWCTKNTSTGICKKANACLSCSMFKPSPEFLNNYCLQLQDVEATIEIAKTNDMEILLQENLKTKETLEHIIAEIKERLT